MNVTLARIREDALNRLRALMDQIGAVDGEVEQPADAFPLDRPAAPAPDLTTEHQRWLFRERVDLQAEMDIGRTRDQGRFLHWWFTNAPIEYGAPSKHVDWQHLAGPVEGREGPFANHISVAMQAIYWNKPKLAERFDLGTIHGRIAYCDWFYRVGLFKYQLDQTPFVDALVANLAAPCTADECSVVVNRFAAFVLRLYKRRRTIADDLSLDDLDAQVRDMIRSRAPELMFLYGQLPDGIRAVPPRLAAFGHDAPTTPLLAAPTTPARAASLDPNRDAATSATKAGPASTGVNMIGYAHGAFGMGEHVKMSARALASWTDQFSVVDVDTYAHARQPEPDILEWSERPERYDTNIFHVNADVMAGTVLTIGPELVRGRYNIGYWAWELAHVPDAWLPSIDFVDEIWAPTRFIQDAFREKTDKPVIHMPLCVDLSFNLWKRRKAFGLPEDKFLFLYYFDSYSYYQRKNPLAALHAFARAFAGRDDVGLVIKTQHADDSSPEWRELKAVADHDPRIHVINRTMSKGEVMSLQAECDCFVSLHRSEGFGRGPAEAMWLGKPVVVTGYSGNMDFTTEDNSLLVDYRLIPVKPLEYPFHRGQSWADPDIDHAASQMRRLVDEPGLAHRLGQRGAQLMRTEYDFRSIGRRYADRLREIGAL